MLLQGLVKAESMEDTLVSYKAKKKAMLDHIRSGLKCHCMFLVANTHCLQAIYFHMACLLTSYELNKVIPISAPLTSGDVL